MTPLKGERHTLAADVDHTTRYASGHKRIARVVACRAIDARECASAVAFFFAGRRAAAREADERVASKRLAHLVGLWSVSVVASIGGVPTEAYLRLSSVLRDDFGFARPDSSRP